MRRRDLHKHDASDNYVSRLLKHWAFAFPLPVNGRALLFEQITQETSNPFLWWNLAFVIIRWFFRNLILKPIDSAFQPVLYFSDVDSYPAYVIHRDSSTMHLLMAEQTISSGMMLNSGIV
jgi:hypothetical protein